MSGANLHRYRVKIFVSDEDGREEYADPDMSVRSKLTGSDLKHWIKSRVAEMLSFEKCNPNNPVIE
jgi:hypothetical protein